MIEKTSAKEFKQFCKDYLEKNCEQQTIQFTVLSGYNICGGAKSKGEDYYSATIKCIAYINERGEIAENDINFTYYLNNKKNLKFIKTKNLTTYKIKCKKFKDKNLYYRKFYLNAPKVYSSKTDGNSNCDATIHCGGCV